MTMVESLPTYGIHYYEVKVVNNGIIMTILKLFKFSRINKCSAFFCRK